MQQKKGDEYFQKHNYSPDTQLFDISTIKTREISIKITFKNNRKKKNCDCSWTQPIENIT